MNINNTYKGTLDEKDWNTSKKHLVDVSSETNPACPLGSHMPEDCESCEIVECPTVGDLDERIFGEPKEVTRYGLDD